MEYKESELIRMYLARKQKFVAFYAVFFIVAFAFAVLSGYFVPWSEITTPLLFTAHRGTDMSTFIDFALQNCSTLHGRLDYTASHEANAMLVSCRPEISSPIFYLTIGFSISAISICTGFALSMIFFWMDYNDFKKTV